MTQHGARRALQFVCVIAAVYAATGCGGDSTGSHLPDGDPGPVHVHGLAAASYQRTFVAAHTGVFIVSPGTVPGKRRIGKPFDVTAIVRLPDRSLLASGHPNPHNSPHTQTADGPKSLLGVIRSRDEGRTWTPLALAGKRYFSLMKASGRVIYGFDPVARELLTSADGGRRWHVAGAPPKDLYDFGVGFYQARRLAATSPEGSWLSQDAGRSWRRTSRIRSSARR